MSDKEESIKDLYRKLNNKLGGLLNAIAFVLMILSFFLIHDLVNMRGVPCYNGFFIDECNQGNYPYKNEQDFLERGGGGTINDQFEDEWQHGR